MDIARPHKSRNSLILGTSEASTIVIERMVPGTPPHTTSLLPSSSSIAHATKNGATPSDEQDRRHDADDRQGQRAAHDEGHQMIRARIGGGTHATPLAVIEGTAVVVFIGRLLRW